MAQKLRFGIFLDVINVPLQYSEFRRLALQSEKLGYDSVWICDHLMKGKAPLLECFTTLSALSSITRKIRLGSLVACNSYRNPALLAKMAATLDVVSNGRLELGIGAGWNREEFRGYGIPFPKTHVRIRQMSEGIEVIRRIWVEEKANYQGKYFKIKDTFCEPKPLQKPHPPITVGGDGEKLTLRVVAKNADRSNLHAGSLEQCKHKLEVLNGFCSQIGRDPQQLEKSLTVVVNIGYNEKDFMKNFKRCYTAKKQILPFDQWLKEYKTRIVMGTPSECTEELRKYVDLGITYFMVRFLDFPDSEGMRSFNEVIQNIS